MSVSFRFNRLKKSAAIDWSFTETCGGLLELTGIGKLQVKWRQF